MRRRLKLMINDDQIKIAHNLEGHKILLGLT